MPRSPALTSTSSSSSEDGSHSTLGSLLGSSMDDSPPGDDDSEALHADAEGVMGDGSQRAPGPACHPPSAPPSGAAMQDPEYHFKLKRQSFVEELLKGICWKHLDRELKQRFSIRQAAAQQREFRKGHCRDPSRTLQFNIAELLPPEQRADLEHMCAALRCMLEEDMPENDKLWLDQLPCGPMPDRLVAMQHFQREIYASLLDRAGPADATLVAHLAVELASNTFYRPAIRLLWPLLADRQRMEVQQWFLRYALQMDERRQAIPASSSSGGR